jgi:hypothetical protein
MIIRFINGGHWTYLNTAGLYYYWYFNWISIPGSVAIIILENEKNGMNYFQRCRLCMAHIMLCC